MLVALVTQNSAELAKTVELSPTLQPEPEGDSRDETTGANDTAYEQEEDYDSTSEYYSTSDMQNSSGDQIATPRSFLPDIATQGLSDNIVFDAGELDMVASLGDQISYRTDKSVSRVETEVSP